MRRQHQPPYGHLYEIELDSGEPKEVAGVHLWLVISDPELTRDGLVIALPTTGQDSQRTNFDVPYRPDDVEALREVGLLS